MSGLQATPIGLVILGIYSLLTVGAALLLGRLIGPFRWRMALVVPPTLVVLGLPWGEEFWIAWHFQKACKGAGVYVNRQVVADGYLDSMIIYDRKSVPSVPQFAHDPSQLAEFEKQGYRFVEHALSDGGARHLERIGGQVMVSIRDKPEARYEFKFHYQPTRFRNEEMIGWKLVKIESQVVDRETGEVLGRDTRITRFPNSIEMLWLRFFGPANIYCLGPLDEPDKRRRKGLICEYVLIPKQST